MLATGDIAGDQEMREAYLEPLFVDMRSDYMPQGANTGDGHKMGMWAGGVMQDGPLPNALHPQGGSMFHGPFMFVNKEGKRYFNEANWVQAKSIQTMKQTDHVGFSIFDKNFPTDNKDSLNHGGGMFWDTMSRSVTQEFDPAEILATVEGEVEQGNTAWKADTLEELADLIGVDKENFLAEVENYNKMCEAGEDTQFEKEPVFLYPIKEPPFYATRRGSGHPGVRGRPEGEHRPGRGEGRRHAHRRPVRHRQHLGRPVRRGLSHQHAGQLQRPVPHLGLPAGQDPGCALGPLVRTSFLQRFLPSPGKGSGFRSPFLCFFAPSVLKAEGAFPDFAAFM